MKSFIVSLLCLWLFAMSGCELSKRANEQVQEQVQEQALKNRLLGAAEPSFYGPSGDAKAFWEQTRRFYAGRQYQPAWIVGSKPWISVQALTSLLSAAAQEGLNPQEYAVVKLQERVRTLNPHGEQAAALNLELALTASLLRYAGHLALGHPIAQQIDQDWSYVPRDIDPVAIVLVAVANNQLDQLPAKLAPQHPEYARLREMLQRYRKLAAEAKLQNFPTNPKLMAEAPSSKLALRHNLIILGDLQEQAHGDDNVFQEDLSVAEAKYKDRNALQPETLPDAAKTADRSSDDENLAAALHRFQSRHGLSPDAVPGAAVSAAMNVPLAQRVRQLEINLERWRWMPADFGAPHIFVNIAAYRLQVRDAQEDVPLKSRVIVGKTTNRTPIFSDLITTIVFSPYWNIPQSIEVKEMLPSINADSDYLKKKDIEVVRRVNGQTQVVDPATIDWAHAEDADAFQLRQRPSDSNALGFVKFIFPNRHSVYLHDTPSDNLFDRLTRDLSHGCVRVERPAALATYLLRDQPEWTAESIATAMHSGTENHVALKNPIQVHLVYLTARVDEDGIAQFSDDVYGYDRKQYDLLQALALSTNETHQRRS